MRIFCMALLGATLFSSGVGLAQQTPASPATPPVGPVATPRIIMLRLYVSDLDRGEKFYHEVFGTTVVRKMGDNVRIMNFPGGTLPGIIMIKSSEEEAHMKGSFLIQVPDVKGTMDRAAANGGAPLNTHFSEKVEGKPAQSTHVTDPDGNLIEVLQIGNPK